MSHLDFLLYKNFNIFTNLDIFKNKVDSKRKYNF